MKASFRTCAAATIAGCAALAVHAQTPTGPLDFGFLVSQQGRGSFTIIGAGARAAAMGGAFTALADDASAASFNPAGLALLLTPEISLVGMGSRQSDRLEDVTDRLSGVPLHADEHRTSFESTNLNFAAMTVPFVVAERNLCLQLSYHYLVDMRRDVDREVLRHFEGAPILRYDQTVRQRGGIHTTSLAAAYQLTPRLSLGGSLSRWVGTWNTAIRNQTDDLKRGEQWRYAYRQQVDLHGLNWNLGVLLRYPYLNVGLMYRSAFDTRVLFRSGATTNFMADVPLSSERHTVDWPSSWTAGIALKPIDTWRVTADYARYNWKDMIIRGLNEDGRDVNFFDLNPIETTVVQNAGYWRFGTELELLLGRTLLSLRGGYFEEPLPGEIVLEDDKATIADLKEVRLGSQKADGYSAGIGIKIGSVTVDLAYQRRERRSVVFDYIDVRDMLGEPLPLVERRTRRDETVLLALLYQPPADFVRKILRVVFVGPDGGGAIEP